MNQQLQTQMSMDASLKNIDLGIKQLAQSLGGGTGNNAATPPSTPPSTISGKRAKATPASLTAVRFDRRITA